MCGGPNYVQTMNSNTGSPAMPLRKFIPYRHWENQSFCFWHLYGETHWVGPL